MSIYQIIVVVASAISMMYAIAAVSRMTWKTNHGIRAAYALMAVGAFGEVMSVLAVDRTPSLSECLFVAGIGLLNFIDRRSIIRCPYMVGENQPVQKTSSEVRKC